MMGSRIKEDLTVEFDKIEDPRIERSKKYPLCEILFLVIVAALMGVESWRSSSLIGTERIEFLRKFFPYINGVPSHQTIGRVFSILKPGSFEKIFVAWSAKLYGSNNGKKIAIDGKTLRGSYDTEKNQSPLHLLNVCAIDNGVTLAQLPVDIKTNEITVVPDILDMLDIKGTTISVDALNTQKNIAKKIIESGADYTLALKENHPNLFENVTLLFDTTKIDDSKEKDLHFESTEKSNGRITIRKYEIIHTNEYLLENSKDWVGLKSIGKVETVTFRDKKEVFEVRYYLLSYLSAKLFAESARGHWGIENKLHWSLDVVYSEDASRKRSDFAPRNYSLIRKFALNICRSFKDKLSVPNFHIKNCVNLDFFQDILVSSGFSLLST